MIGLVGELVVWFDSLIGWLVGELVVWFDSLIGKYLSWVDCAIIFCASRKGRGRVVWEEPEDVCFVKYLGRKSTV